MHQKNGSPGKALAPLLGILAVLAMAVAATASYFLMQERDHRLAKEQELRVALAENEDLNSRLQDLQQAKVKVEGDIARLRTEFSQAQEKLVAATQAQETLAHSVEDREKEIGRLTKDLEQARTQQSQLQAQFADLQTERETLQQHLTDLEQAKGQLESKVMELTQQPTVELDKVMVTNERAAATQSAATPMLTAASGTQPSGQVMNINREYDFIILNLGKNHGVSVGQELQIVRGDQVLGKVKVEKVYDELSAATILPESKKDSIREGDLVKAL